MRDRIEELPTGTLGVRRRVGEIVFNSSLVAEMQAISAMRGLAEPRHAAASVANVRLHRIGPPPVALFDQGSGMDRTRPWLQLLHDEGKAAGREFMARHGADIGVRETLDVAQAFLDTNKPRIPLPGTTPHRGRRRISTAAVDRTARGADISAPPGDVTP
jgi:NTE family protein